MGDYVVVVAIGCQCIVVMQAVDKACLPHRDRHGSIIFIGSDVSLFEGR